MDLKTFNEKMAVQGWVVLPDLVSDELRNRMLDDIESAYRVCRNIQSRNGIDDETTNTVHHLPILAESFVDFLDPMPIQVYVESFFEGPFILNSFGGALNKTGASSYANRIHRDVRTYTSDIKLMLNTLIMLDDFTEENGATRLLSGSHRHAEKPDEVYFNAKAESAIGAAGSILLFDSNIWHAAGVSTVSAPRRSVTPLFTRPFMKQQFDYPRAFGYKHAELISEELRQILGYNARVPANLEEWYQPPENRMYKPGQG